MPGADEPKPKFEFTGAQPESTGIDFNKLKPGDSVQLTNGAVAEVVENPRDGYWIIVRYIKAADNPELVGSTEPVMFTDLAGVT